MNKNKEIKQDEILDDKNDLVGDEMLDKDEYIAKLNDDLNEQKKKTDGFLPPALDKGTQVGKLYTKAVMSAYHAEKLTPREASNYLLGLRVKHFEAVERWCY
mgnify:CR=1 FL=1